MVENSKKAVVIGASSGIGRALAKVLSDYGYQLGLAARRIELLRELQNGLPNQSFIKQIDISQPLQAQKLLQELINEMQGMDLIILNSGINTHNINLNWLEEKATIDINVSGFVAMANLAVRHFLAQRSGQIVGISSIAALMGNANNPAYNASKAFVSNYLKSLRYRLQDERIYVSDIRPGFVDTAIIRKGSGPFWVATPEKAAEQIFQAINKKRKVVYVTKRWNLISGLIKLMPDWLFYQIQKLHRKSAANNSSNGK